MSQLLDKIKLLIEKFRTKKISYERGGIKPLRDWRVFLYIIFITLCILIVLAFYIYTKVENSTLFVVSKDNTESLKKINQTLLEKTIDDINIRQKAGADVRNGAVSAPVDPSI